MIVFKPEFHALVAALWETYQPTIWVWLALMFAAIVILGFGVVSWNVLRKIT